MANRHSSGSVTGRDDLIITKALAYAVETIRRLPTHLQEASDAADMQRLLEHMMPDASHRQYRIDGARAHMDTLRVVSPADVAPLRPVL
jgi:hypothetical protein